MKTKRFDEVCLSECFVGQALDGMCVGMILTNPAGRVLWMNRAAYGMLGVDRDEWSEQLLGQVLKDPKLSEFWHRACSAGDHAMGEVSLRWPREAELKVNYATCAAPDGAEIGRALLFCDVTADRALQLSLSEEATKQLLDLARSRQETQPEAGLTPQELTILKMVGCGLGNQEIAAELHVAVSTIRSHLKSVYRKTGLTSRSEAVRYAIEHALA